MTNFSQYERSAAIPAPGFSMIKSAPAEPPAEGDGVQGVVFGDILATVAQDPERSDRKDDATMSSDSTDEACFKSCVVLAGRSESMLHLDACLPEAPREIQKAGRSCNTAGILQTDPDQQGSRPAHRIEKAQVPGDETAGLLSMGAHILAPREKIETPKFPGSPTPLPESAAKSAAGAGSVSERLVKRQTFSHFSPSEKILPEQALACADVGEPQSAVTTQNETFSSALPVTTSEISPDTISASPLAQPIYVKELATHLPVMITRTVIDLLPLPNDGAVLTIASPLAVAPEPIRVKILTFDLHPATLGPLTIRMRLSGKQVEISIDVRSEDVRTILTQTKEAMVKALAEHGLRLETSDIRLTMTAAPSIATTEPGAASNQQNILASSESFGQNHGHAHHDEGSAYSRHPSQPDEQAQKARNDLYDVDKRAGIYL